MTWRTIGWLSLSLFILGCGQSPPATTEQKKVDRPQRPELVKEEATKK
jgi:hypothetical protein